MAAQSCHGVVWPLLLNFLLCNVKREAPELCSETAPHFTEGIFLAWYHGIIGYGYASYPCVFFVLVSAELSGNDL